MYHSIRARAFSSQIPRSYSQISRVQVPKLPRSAWVSKLQGILLSVILRIQLPYPHLPQEDFPRALTTPQGDPGHILLGDLGYFHTNNPGIFYSVTPSMSPPLDPQDPETYSCPITQTPALAVHLLSWFIFSQAETLPDANMKISFERRDHGDGNPFDGAHGILDHAFPPTDGQFCYDIDEQWSVGAKPGAVDLETVALHEIGHLLGLKHSSIKEAIMYPLIDDEATKGLHADDIQGIKALYNA
ncbi:Metalloendoproteinase 1 [Morella rubra]|uniref:Metalloendoproteinase 1 n=1 Tax=Morella rubra TaxID=262757 RepID=A0A6A1W253_9ROSI|nr:Metalloendoproteinase 1 [Morella rubra]